MAKKSTKLQALNEIFEEHEIDPMKIAGNDTLIQELKKHADTVIDYRKEAYVKHLLVDVIMITFFAILGNANEWGEIESFAKKKEVWLRQYLELPYGIPTDDTFRLIISNIDTSHFFHVTTQMLLTIVDELISMGKKEDAIYEKSILAVDGKESRGSKRKTGVNGEVKALQTLNVYSDDYGICVGQEFIESKTNEIPAAQKLLGLMDLNNMIVTADAMNCQKETVATIVKKKGDYVLALKGNQHLFYEEVKDFFEEKQLEEIKASGVGYHKTVEKEHGGVAVREYYITQDIQWYSQKKAWKNLTSFGVVKKTMTKMDGSKQEEARFYICSIEANAEEFARAVRGHWNVENQVHWHLDFTFQDDKNTSMEKTGAKNLQIMKKLALSILRLVKESYKISMKRIRYELSLDFEEGIEKMFALLDLETVKTALGMEA